MILSSLIFFIWFIIAIFFAFYIPGWVVINSLFDKNHDRFSVVVISIIVGLVFWAWQGFIFGYLGARFLSYVYIAIFTYLWFKKQKNFDIRKYIYRIRKSVRDIRFSYSSFILILIFLIGIFGQIQQFFISGFVFSDGIHILTAASDDALWHTSLIAQIVRRFPPFEPGLAGITVYNYHYWSNLVIAELIRVFYLPLLQTQFQYMYLLMSFLLGGAAYALGKLLKLPIVGLLVFVYLQYFSSDVIYIITFFSRKVFEFSVHPLEDGTMFLENPPRAFSFVVTLCGLFILLLWIRKKNFKSGLLTILIFGSVIGFKIHTGVLVIAGFAGLAIYYLFKFKWKMLVVPLLVLVTSFIIYFPVNGRSGMPFFSPFEKSREFIVQNKLQLSSFELARRIYDQHHNFIQELRMDVTMFVIFMLAQFGIRNIGWLSFRKTINTIGAPFTIFLYCGILVTVFLGTFFLQPVAQADIFNFFLAASFFLSIPAAISLGRWLGYRNLTLRIIIVVLIAVCTLPRWVYKTSSFEFYFKKLSPNIYADELRAMKFLRESTSKKDVVLVSNQGQWDSVYPYVSAFSQRDMYLSGQTILGRHGIPYKNREEIVKQILGNTTESEVKKLLIKNNINILYFYAPQVWAGSKYSFIKEVFKNNEITIFSFDKRS